MWDIPGTPLEVTAAILGFLSVFFTVRASMWMWPTGLIMVTMYAKIFYDYKLYSDSILQVVYIGLQIYGWYFWMSKGGSLTKSNRPITTLDVQQILASIVIATVATILIGYTFYTYTDASVPYFDAAIVSLSLVAQWHLDRKRRGNWIFWIAVDLIAVPVYYYKELYFTAALYTLFLVMAVSGYFAWNKKYKAQVAA